MKTVYFMSLFALSTTVLAADSSTRSNAGKDDHIVLIEVQGSLKHSIPALEFLMAFKQKINSDSGSLQAKLSVCHDENLLFVTIVAPRERKDLAEFALHYLVSNYIELSVPYTATKFERAKKLMCNLENRSEMIIAHNRATNTIYMAGFKEVCEKLVDNLTDESISIILVQNTFTQQ